MRRLAQADAAGIRKAARAVGHGARAHLWIADNGSGMDESTLARVFEPFFTTKQVGQGTGLGLAVVHGIVSVHGGAIQVDSTPGVGSRFDLWFPLQDAPAPRRSNRSTACSTRRPARASTCCASTTIRPWC